MRVELKELSLHVLKLLSVVTGINSSMSDAAVRVEEEGRHLIARKEVASLCVTDFFGF